MKYSYLAASLSGLLLFLTPVGVISQLSSWALEQNSVSISSEQLQQLIKAVTVKVFANQNSGSGTLISKDGSTYTVITNAHITESGQPYRIQTVDGKTYLAKILTIVNFGRRDVTLLQFESKETYTIPPKITANWQLGEKIFTAGFPYDTEQLRITTGEISFLPEKNLEGGYKIGYSNEIQQGMSGGPIFNNKGELIGINGRRAFPIVEHYRFEDGSEPDAPTKEKIRQFSWGIGVAEVVEKLDTILLYKQGITYYENKDYLKALETFNEVIKKYPNYPEAYFQRALARMGSAYFYGHDDSMTKYLWNLHHQESKADMEQAAKLFEKQGNNIETVRSQAYVAWYGEDYVKAIDNFTQVLKLNNKDIQAYLGRGKAYRYLDKQDEALADFNKAIQLQPNEATIYQFRAIAYANKKNYEAAEKDLNKAITLEPKFIEAYYTRSDLRLNMQKSQEALADINKVIELNPNSVEAYQERGFIYMGIADFDKALADSNRAIELNPDYFEPYMNRSAIYTRKGDYQKVIENANKYIQLDPDPKSFIGYILRGQAQVLSGKCALGRPDLEKARQIMEDNKETDNYVYANTQEVLKVCQSSQPSIADILTKIDKIAQEITVKIDKAEDRKCNQGSGVIIAHQNNTYTVLTAEHVLSNCQKFRVITPDQQSYEVNGANVQKIKRADLALFQFTSSRSYTVAKIANYRIRQPAAFILISGFPASETHRQLSYGTVFQEDFGNLFTMDARSFTYGYGLIYTNLTSPGMSGAPILDTEGRIIGIHGRAEGEDLILQGNPSSTPTYLGFSMGVPIRNLIQTMTEISILPQNLSVETKEPESLPLVLEPKLKEALSKNIPVPNEQDNAAAWINYGNQLWRSDLYPEAQKAFEKALQRNPNSFEAWYNLGLLNQMLLNDTQALEFLNKSIQYKPDFMPSWYRKGVILLELEQYQEALNAFNKVIRDDKDSIVAYHQRGMAYSNLGNYPKAIADLTKAIQLAPNSAFFYEERGTTYKSANKYQKAIEDYTKAIELDPEALGIHNRRGLAYDELEEYEKALADYKKEIALNPKFSSPYNNQAIIYENLQNYQEALTEINKAIELEPKSSTFYDNRADIYIKLKDYQKALAEYSKFIEVDAKSAISYNYRGNFYLNILRDYEKALADYNEAIKIDPKDLDYYTNRANTQTRLYNYPQAEEEYDEIIKRFPKSAASYNYRGYFYKETLKDYKKAIANYTEAIKLDPTKNYYYGNRGEVYLLLEDYPKALADFEQAININSGVPTYYDKKARVYAELNDYKKALAEYERFLKIDDESAGFYNVRGNFYFYPLKNYEKAIADYTKAITLTPKEKQYYYNRAYAYVKLKNYAKAESEYNEIIKHFPTFAKSYDERGDFYKNTLREYQKAITDYKTAIELDPYNAEYYVDLADAYRNLQDYGQAVTEVNQALKVQKDFPRAYLQLGWISYAVGDQNKALDYFKLALSKDPKYDWAISGIGIVQYEMGNKEGAIKEWRSSLEFTKNESIQFALAVALFAQGNQQEALKLAEKALKKNSDLADLTKLQKDYFWGNSLLTEAQKFLSLPQIQVLTNSRE